MARRETMPTDRPGQEIEITPEMVEAGADVLLGEFGGDGSNHFWSAPDLAREVYRAMTKAAKA
jgi:hypothetical protein